MTRSKLLSQKRATQQAKIRWLKSPLRHWIDVKKIGRCILVHRYFPEVQTTLRWDYIVNLINYNSMLNLRWDNAECEIYKWNLGQSQPWIDVEPTSEQRSHHVVDVSTYFKPNFNVVTTHCPPAGMIHNSHWKNIWKYMIWNFIDVLLEEELTFPVFIITVHFDTMENPFHT